MSVWKLALLMLFLSAGAVAGQDTAPKTGGARNVSSLDAELKGALQRGESRTVARLAVELGEAHRLNGNLAEAIERLEAALKLPEVRNDLELYATACSDLGKAYAGHGNLERALALIDESATTYKKAGNRIAEDQQIQLKAMLLALRGERGRAANVLSSASRNGEAPAATTEGGLPTPASLFAFIVNGEYERVITVVEEAMKRDRVPPGYYWLLGSAYFNVRRYDDAVRITSAGVTRAERAGNTSATSWSHYWGARSLDRLGRIQEAADEMLAAVRVQESVRSNLLADDAWKRAFGDSREHLAHEVIDLVWRAGRFPSALEVAEIARARAFLDLVSDGSSSISPADSAERLTLRARRSGTPVIAYWTHPDGVFIWLITPGGQIHASRSAVSSTELSKLITRARSVSDKPDQRAWKALHALLIQPVLSLLPKQTGTLTLLPHGALLNLPFAALMDTRGRYLVEDYAIRTVPVSAFIDKPSRPNDMGSYLMVGAPTGASNMSGGRLPVLPGAERELKVVAAAAPRGSTTLIGKAAELAPIRQQMPDARVLHFATHAIVDAERPFESFLALSNGGKLRVDDIYQLRLHANLVLLSACRTGSGKVTADGLLGFTRAFLGAGASTVIAPLWDIPDEPTSSIFVEFYKLYGQGIPATSALRSAQLKLLQDLRAGRVQVNTLAGPVALTEHPILWAGFVVQGAE